MFPQEDVASKYKRIVKDCVNKITDIMCKQGNTIANLFFRTRNRMHFLSCNFIIFHDVINFTVYCIIDCIHLYFGIYFLSPECDSLYLTISLLLFYHCSFTSGIILRSSRRYISYIYFYLEFLYDKTTLFFKGNL